MKNTNIEEVKKYLKRSLKKKVKITTSLIVLFMMSNSIVSMADNVTIDKGIIGEPGFAKTGYKKGVVALNPKDESAAKPQKEKIGDYSIAIGLGAEADSVNSVSIGHEANVKTPYSVAVGFNSKVYDSETADGKGGGGQGVAIGSNTQAVSQATSVGNDTYALGHSSIALGSDDIDTYYKDEISSYDYQKYFKKLYDEIDPITEEDIKKGGQPKYGFANINGKINRFYSVRYSPTLAQGKGSIAIGSRTVAYENGSTALGTLAFALKEKSTALGTHTRAEGVGAIAIGNDTKVFSDNSVGAGNNIQILQKGGMGFGYDIISGGENSISIGTKVYSNVKTNSLDDGIHKKYQKNKNDFIFGNTYIQDNLETLENTLSKIESADNLANDKSFDISKKEHNGVANIGESNGSKNAITIGTSSMALSENSIGIGHGTFSTTKNSMALGSYSYVNGENSLGLGVYSKVFSKNSIAIGTGSGVAYDADNSLVMGVASYSKGMNGLVFGNKSKVTVKDGLAIGSNSEVSLANSTALGVNSKTDYKSEWLEEPGYAPKGAISSLTSKGIGVVSIGTIGKERRLTNLASGYRDTDAVNVSQLRSLEEKLSSVNPDEEDTSMLNYLSVDKNNIHGEGYQVKDIALKEVYYKEYIRLKAKELEIKVRKERNGETFKSEYTNKIKKRIEELEGKNIEAINDAKTNDYGQYTDEYIKERTKTVDSILREISESKDKALAKKQTDILSADEIAKLNASNYNNDGAKGADAIALGYGANAKGDQAVAIGKKAEGTGKQSVVIGTSNSSNNAVSDNDDNATDTSKDVTKMTAGNSSVSIGNGVKSKNYSVGIGGNVVAGETAVAIGDRARAIKTTSVAIGSKALANGAKSIAIGNKTQSNAEDSYVFGGESEISETASQSSAIGYKVSVKSSQAVAMGNDVLVEENSRGAVAIGSDDSSYNEGNNKIDGKNYTKTTAKGNATTAIGAHAQATNVAATALGARAFATGKETVAVGANSKASVEGAVAIGSYSLADQATNTTYYNPKTGKADGNVQDKLATKAAVSIGDAKNGVRRQLIGLAAGTNDTDAVNVWQLKELKSYFDEKAKFTVKADMAPHNTSTEKSMSLGNTLEFTGRKFDGTAKFDSWTVKDADTKNGGYTSENVETFVTQDNGKTSVLIGLRKDPRFDKVTVGGENKTEITDSGINITKKVTENNNKVDKVVKFGIDDSGNATLTDARNTTASPIVTEATLGEQKISYTANSDANKKQTSLTTGFDFTSNDLEIKTEDNGKVTFKLSDKVKNSLNGEAGTVVYTDSEGNRLVKANDGKYYKKEFVEDGGKVKAGAQDKGVENPELRLVDAKGETTKPITLGNVASALGLSKDKKDDRRYNKQVIEKLINKEAKNDLEYTEAELNKVVTLRDLQFLASKGITFAGSTGKTTKFLGDRIKINSLTSVTQDSFPTKYETENIAVKVDDKKGNIEIGLAKELTKINSITSEKDANDNTQTKITLSKDGATFGVEKEVLVGKHTTTEQVGVKTTIDKDGISVTKKGETTPSVSIKESSIEFATKEEGQDPNKKTVGTGSITGLKDLDGNSDGHMATNKNYVDKKVKTTEDTVTGKITALEEKKLGFTGNTGTKVEKKLGEEIAIKGDDSSITTEAGNNAITIKVKDQGITSNKIADKNVTENKLADELLNKINASNTVATNTITLSGDNGENNKPTKTSAEALNKDGGINFSITGEDGLKTTASGTNVKIGMTENLKNKIAKLDNLGNTYATKTELNNKANTTLDNITDAGKKVIKDIAKNAVEVTSDNGSGIKVESTKGTDKTTYKLSLDEDKIKSLAGTTNIAKDYAKVDASNITDDANKNAWINALGTDSVRDTIPDDEANNRGKGKLVTERAVQAVKNDLSTKITNLTTGGLKFAGNNTEEIVTVPLGEQLNIKGAGTDTTINNIAVADDNIKVQGDKTKKGLTVGLSKNLKNIEDITFKGANGKDGKIGVDRDGNITVTNGIDGANGQNGTTSKVVTENTIGNQTLAYKSNSSAKNKTVTLSKGLDFTNGTNTTAEIGDNGVVKFNLNENLTGVKSIKGLEKADGSDDTAAASVAYVKEQITNAAGSTKDLTLKLTTDGATDAGTVKLSNQKLKVTGKDGVKVAIQNQGITVGLEEAYKNKLDKLADAKDGKDGKNGTDADSSGSKGLTGKDGLNGKDLTEKVNALRNGEAGTVVYTDPTTGERLVKGNDGKYYRPEQLDEKGNVKADADLANKPAVENPVLSLVNANGETTKPTSLNNIANGLDGVTNSTDKTPITADKAKEAIAGADGKSGLLTQKTGLDKAATVGDLQAIAQAGLDFAGNVGDTHRALGQKLSVVGKNGVTSFDDYSTDNIATRVTEGKVEIGMLKNPKFESAQLGDVKLTPSADGSKLTLSNEKNPTATDKKVVLDGLKDGETPDSAVTKGTVDDLKKQLGLDGKNNDATNGKNGENTPGGKDGLNGKTVTDKIDALRGGEAGPVVYTNENGDRLVRGKDGNLYKSTDLADKVYVDGEGYYDKDKVNTAADGTVTLKDPTNKGDGKVAVPDQGRLKVVHSLVNAKDGTTTSESVLTNVAKGKIADDSKDAVNGSQLKDVLDKAGIKVDQDGNVVAPTINPIKGVDGRDGKAATTVVDGLNNVIDTVNSGITFGGDLGTATKQQLGSKLEVKKAAAEITDNNVKYSGDNLITKYDNTSGNGVISVGLSKTPKFDSTQLGDVKLTPSADGSKLTLSNEKDPNATDKNVVLNGIADGKIAADSKDAVNGSQLKDVLDKAGIKVKPDGTVQVVDGKDGKDGKDANSAGSKGATGKDGLNGKDLTEKVNALRNGEAGTVVYTDPTTGERLVKGNDGKYYRPEQLDEKGNVKADADLENKPAVENPVLSLVNGKDGKTTTRTALGNLANGLDGVTNSTDKTPITADKAKEAIAGANGKPGLLAQTTGLDKAATVGDLQALAQAGLDFDGNSGINGTTIHRTLGSKVMIIGEGTNDIANFASASGNIQVKSDKASNTLTVTLSKDLKNINTISSEEKDGKTTTITLDGKDGMTVKPGEGDTSTNIGKDGIGIKGKDGKDRVSITGKDGGTVEVGKDANGKAAVTINGKDGKDGKIEFAKDAGGKGTGTITGLKDPEIDPATGKAKDPTAAANAGFVDKTVKDALNSLTGKEMSFAGNDGDTVGRKLGETLTIKGEGTVDKETAADNIKVSGNKTDGSLTIGLAKDLKNIESISSKPKDGKTTTITLDGKDGMTVKPGEGDTSTNIGKDGVTVESNNTTNDKAKTVIGKDGIGIKGKDGKDGISIKGDNGTDGNTIVVKGKDGKDGVSITGKDGGTVEVGKDANGKAAVVINGKDGKEGKIEFAKDANGKGTGTITGLKDPEIDPATGKAKDPTAATTVNYVNNYVDSKLAGVDDKLEAVDRNRPFEYFDKDGNKVVRAKNGKLYKETDVEKGVAKTGAIDIAPSNVVIKAMPTVNNEPLKVTNIAKADLTDKSTDAVNGSQLKSVMDAAGIKTDKNGNIVQPDFNGNKVKNPDGTDGEKPTDIKDAIDKTINTLNKGMAYGSDNVKADLTKPQYLGSSLTIKSADEGKALRKTGNDSNFVGKNIVTEYTKDAKGNGTVTVAISEKPEFKEVTATDKITVGKDAISIKGNDGKDGKDGGPSIEFKKVTEVVKDANGNPVKDKNGKDVVVEKGTGTISGIKDPERNQDGSLKDPTTAANNASVDKVDQKVKDLTDKVNNKNDQMTKQLHHLGKEIDGVRSESRKIGSLGAAMAALNPMEYDPMKPNQVLAGVGSYKNSQAVAVGMSHHFNENLRVQAGVSVSQGRRTESMVNLGLAWKIGKDDRDDSYNKYKEGPISSIYVMQDEMKQVMEENKNLKSEVEEMKKQLQTLIKQK